MKTLEKVFIAILWLLALILAIYLFHSSISKPIEKSSSNYTSPTIKINSSNFEKEMAKNYVLAALPSEAVLSLRLYHYNNEGTIFYDKNYILKRGYVKEGLADSPDITLGIPSSYLTGLTNKNFCTIIQKSKVDGSLIFESSSSVASLAWKFKSMYAYRGCLGF